MKKILIHLLLMATTFVTTAQTLNRIKPINRDPNSGIFTTYESFSGQYRLFKNKLYFSDNDSASGQEMWVTDGTLSGTYMLKDINPGGNNTGCHFTRNSSAVYKDQLFFNGMDSTHGVALWKTDGSNNGTVLVKGFNRSNIYNFAFADFLSNFNTVNGYLTFVANDSVHGEELWTTNGTPNGTHLLKDINASYANSYPYRFKLYKDKLYFTAFDSVHGREIWVTDGTSIGTHLFIDLQTFNGQSNIAQSSSPTAFHVFNNELYFIDDQGSLYKTDGTSSGTILLSNPITREPYVRPQIKLSDHHSVYQYFTEMGGKLYFKGETLYEGEELWTTDGTASGTQLVYDNFSGPSSGIHGEITVLNNTHLVFTGRDTSQPYWVGIFSSDGTANGTHLILKTHKWSSSYQSPRTPRYFKEYNNKIYFNAGTDTSAVSGPFGTGGFTYTMWVTDGTAAGTYEALDTALFLNGPPIIYNNRMYFRTASGINDYTLWESAGDTASTKPIFPTGNITMNNIMFRVGSQFPRDNDYIEYNGSLIFSANWYGSDGSPWKLTTSPLSPLSTQSYQRNEMNFVLYPNPANTSLKIDIDDSIIEVELFDMSGRQLFKGNKKEVDISHCKNGLYILRVHANKGMGTASFQVSR